MLRFSSSFKVKVGVLAVLAALGMFASPGTRAAPSGEGGLTLDPVTALMVEQAVAAVMEDWIASGVTPPAPGEVADPLVRTVNSTCAPDFCSTTGSVTTESHAGSLTYDIVVVSGTTPETAAILAIAECNEPDSSTTLPLLCSGAAGACTALKLDGELKRTALLSQESAGQSDRHTMATVVGEEIPGAAQSDCIPRLGQLFGESDTFDREDRLRGRDLILGEGHSVYAEDLKLKAKAFIQYRQSMKGNTGEVSKTATQCRVFDGDVICDYQAECRGPIVADQNGLVFSDPLRCETDCGEASFWGCEGCAGCE